MNTTNQEGHIQNTPLQNEAMYLRNEANSLLIFGQIEEAILKYTASLDFYKGDEHVWLNRARAYDKLGMITEAASDRKTAEALKAGRFIADPNTGEITFNGPNCGEA